MLSRGQHLLGLSSVLLCAAAAGFHGVCRAVDALLHVLRCALHAWPLRPCPSLCGLHCILQACTHVVIALTPCPGSHSPAAHWHRHNETTVVDASVQQILQSRSPVLCDHHIVLLSAGACCESGAHDNVTGSSSKGGTHCQLCHQRCHVLTAPCQRQPPSGSRWRSGPGLRRT